MKSAWSSPVGGRRWFAAALVLMLTLAVATWWVYRGPGGRTLELDGPGDPGLEGALDPAVDLRRSKPSGELSTPAATAKRENPGASAAQLAGKGVLHVQVVERTTGLPVQRIEIQTLPSREETLRTGADGRVEFLADPGELSLLLETRGTPYFCGEPEAPEDAEWIGSWDDIEAGKRYDVTTEVMRSGSILGQWRTRSGEELVSDRVYCSPQTGDAWGPATSVNVRGDGSFRVQGLPANRYLLGPQPGSSHAFPFEIVTLAWGEEETVEVTEQEKLGVRVVVSVVQKGSGLPWPLPFGASLTRKDTMSSLIRQHVFPKQRRTLGQGQATIEGQLAPGIYELEVESQDLMLNPGLRWIAARWTETREVIVKEGEPLALELEIESPACGDVAWVSGEVVGEGPEPRIRAAYTRRPRGPIRAVEFRLGELHEGSRPFRLGVALELIPSGILDIQQRTGGDWETLRSLSLIPGEQSVAVTAR